MSASICLSARRHRAGEPRVAVLATLPIIIILLAAGIAAADLPRGVVRLTPADAERSGTSFHLVRHAVRGSSLVEVEPASAGMSLLAVSADGGTVALADQIAELTAVLTLAAVDGSQLRISLPGLLAATFAPDGSWLAVIDGRGAVWHVDATLGGSDLIAAGPFIGSPLIGADGSLVMLAVPSVEAPYRSRLVRVVLDTGAASLLSAQELVYAAFPLDDGDLAVVAHGVTGTVVSRLGDVGERVMADLGAGAVNVSVAGDGRMAFEVTGGGIFLVDRPGSTPIRVGAGTRPCFAPDGRSVLVSRGQQRVALSLDGSQLAEADAMAGYAGSAGCLS
ncbi:MAG TPA: hypothetical protein VL687_04500 [Methylomirabilota bacterium]|nr:hypothetical protein [Methylomirabilota bacterium]